MSTLVFDVESTLVPLPASPAEASEDDQRLYITTRWYIDLGSNFDDVFQPRPTGDEVGYFAFSRGLRPNIHRFATTRYRDRAPVRYYIKNVPAAYRDAFSAGFDDCNAITGTWLHWSGARRHGADPGSRYPGAVPRLVQCRRTGRRAAGSR